MHDMTVNWRWRGQGTVQVQHRGKGKERQPFWTCLSEMTWYLPNLQPLCLVTPVVLLFWMLACLAYSLPNGECLSAHRTQTEPRPTWKYYQQVRKQSAPLVVWHKMSSGTLFCHALERGHLHRTSSPNFNKERNTLPLQFIEFTQYIMLPPFRSIIKILDNIWFVQYNFWLVLFVLIQVYRLK